MSNTNLLSRGETPTTKVEFPSTKEFGLFLFFPRKFADKFAFVAYAISVNFSVSPDVMFWRRKGEKQVMK